MITLKLKIMKKLVFILSLAVVVIGTTLLIFIVKFNIPGNYVTNNATKAHFTFPPNALSLNGVDFNPPPLPAISANQMIINFVDDNTSSDAQTAIWISRDWIEKVAAFLTTEHTEVGADGIRIYFGKKSNAANKMINTIVIVSTQKLTSDPLEHTDYFSHDVAFSSFLKLVKQNPQAYFQEDHSGNDKGALLYGLSSVCSSAFACVATTAENLDCQIAYAAVNNLKNRGVGQGVNTDSEWFPTKLLTDLAYEFSHQTTQNITPDGMRLYFAKKTDNHRHFFIGVPTQENGHYGENIPSHLDNFDCYGTHSFFGPTDNGEQCPNNCTGVSLPQ
jgi:hypothetical protein